MVLKGIWRVLFSTDVILTFSLLYSVCVYMYIHMPGAKTNIICSTDV